MTIPQVPALMLCAGALALAGFAGGGPEAAAALLAEENRLRTVLGPESGPVDGAEACRRP